MSPAARRSLVQAVLVAAAIIALPWMRYRGPRVLKDVVAYGSIAGGTFVVAYFALRSVLARRHTNDSVDDILVARARSSGWYYAGIVAIGVALFANVMILVFLVTDFRQFAPRLDANLQGQSSDLSVWLGAALVPILFGSFFTWLSAYQIKLTASSMEYWSLFGGHRLIKLGDIKKAGIRIGRDGNRPPIRLEIVPEPDLGNPIIVNLKVFKKSDLDRLYAWLGPKLEHRGTHR